MLQIVLVIHLLIAVGLVGVVLLQRSEGGALGIGGGGGGGFMTGRGTANLLTRTTAILAACFFATSLVLAVLASGTHKSGSIMDGAVPTAPASSSAPAAPAAPTGPQVPLSK
ncbi:MAG: preprotein translocase subunit SecG [Alphaproteobacteria bacterium]|nr:preprotein translocase subunit SecG [Alphaproteobacteria bacterium]